MAGEVSDAFFPSDDGGDGFEPAAGDDSWADMDFDGDDEYAVADAERVAGLEAQVAGMRELLQAQHAEQVAAGWAEVPEHLRPLVGDALVGRQAREQLEAEELLAETELTHTLAERQQLAAATASVQDFFAAGGLDPDEGIDVASRMWETLIANGEVPSPEFAESVVAVTASLMQQRDAEEQRAEEWLQEARRGRGKVSDAIARIHDQPLHRRLIEGEREELRRAARRSEQAKRAAGARWANHRAEQARETRTYWHSKNGRR